MAVLQFREPFSAWSHLFWMVLVLPGTLYLWQRSAGNRAKQLSLAVFGLSMVFCYAGSVLYHSVRVARPLLEGFDQLDHIGIFVLIAGSYTPLAWNLLRGHWRWGTLLASWVATLLGTVLVLQCGALPPAVATLLYLLMGWGAIFCYFDIARRIPHRHLRPLVLGGVLYSVGALINILRWPVLWPNVIGAHELFHVFVMAGSLSHFWFMLTVVAPMTNALRFLPVARAREATGTPVSA
jgi:hemolysin III